MTMKKYWWLGVLVVGAVAAALVKPSGASQPGDKIGSTLLDPKKVTELTQVVLTNKDGKATTLAKGDDGAWTIGQENFPVDANRLGSFFDAIAQAKIARRIGKSQEGFATVGLDKPMTLRLSAGEKPILDLRIGESRQGGGAFVAFAGSDESFLVDKSIPFNNEDEYWELKTLVNVDAKALKSVAFKPAATTGKVSVTLTRDDAEKSFELSDLAAGEGKNEAALGSVASLLSQVQFTKKDPLELAVDKDAMATASEVTAERFDGTVYQIKVGKAGETGKEKWYARITAVPPSGKELATAQDKLVNQLMAKYSFEISSYVGSKFEKARNDFILEPKKPDAG